MRIPPITSTLWLLWLLAQVSADLDTTLIGLESSTASSSVSLNSPRRSEPDSVTLPGPDELSNSDSSPALPMLSLVFVFDLVRASSCRQFGNGLKAPEEVQGGEQLARVAQWTLKRMKEVNPRTLAHVVDAIDLYSMDTCGNVTYSVSKILSMATQEHLIMDPDDLLDVKDSLASNPRSALNTSPGMEDNTTVDECAQVFGGFYVATSLSREIEIQLAVLPSLPIHSLGGGDLFIDADTLEACVALVKRLHWHHVVVLAETEEIIRQFSDIATQEEICIVDSLPMVQDRDDFGMHSWLFGHNSTWSEFGTSNIVYLGRPSRLVHLLKDHATEGFHWILPFVPEINDFEGVEHLYFVRKTYHNLPEFSADQHWAFEDTRLRNVSRAVASAVLNHEQQTAKTVKCRARVPTHVPMIGESQFQRVLNLSSASSQASSSSQPAASPSSSSSWGKERVFSIYRVNSSKARNERHELIGEFSPESRKLTLWHPLEPPISASDRQLGFFSAVPWNKLEPACLNLPVYPLAQSRVLYPAFRMEPWIIILITIGAVGILVALAILLYIASKVCAEVVDGSQSLSILFLLSIMFMYATLIPFGFYPDPIVCLIRLYATRLAYALVFAILLSRSLMLATADTDGLPGHVSGVVQAFLLLMMTGFQVGLSTQEWFLRERPFSTLVIAGRYEHLECSDRGIPVIWNLAYVMILLVLQVIISPFIVASRRNYKEGFLFCLASVVCLVLWLAWTVSYVVFGALLGEIWYDIIQCIGLTATATCLLLVIFIPKCYMMATPPYSKSTNRGHHVNASVSLQRINDISTSASSSGSHMTPANSHQNNLQVLGTTTSSSTTDDRGFDHSNHTMTDYLNTSDLYDSLKDPVTASTSSPHASSNPVEFVTKSSLLQQIRLRNTDTLSSGEDSRFKSRPQSTFQNDYPTFKLDRGAVVDTSMKFERYGYPGLLSAESHSDLKDLPPSHHMHSSSGSSIASSAPPPPPPKPMEKQARISSRGTRF